MEESRTASTVPNLSSKDKDVSEDNKIPSLVVSPDNTGTESTADDENDHAVSLLEDDDDDIDVIELLDDDDDEEIAAVAAACALSPVPGGADSPLPLPIHSTNTTENTKKRKLSSGDPPALPPKPQPVPSNSLQQPQPLKIRSLPHLPQEHQKQNHPPQIQTQTEQPKPQIVTSKTTQPNTNAAVPSYIPIKEGFVPTWNNLLSEEFFAPSRNEQQRQNQKQWKSYQLSLLGVDDFTITGLPIYEGGPNTPLTGLRQKIKQIARDHGGKAVFERIQDTTGVSQPSLPSPMESRWKIPLAAYQAFFAFLTQQPNTSVIGIPQQQLAIASLGRQRKLRGCPSPRDLQDWGIPAKIAHTLAPFQREGVGFCHEKEGRALIADEMGLGKSIQAVASMSIYHKDWPVLVLSPSGARYHWQNEFLNWLGEENADTANKKSKLNFHESCSASRKNEQEEEYVPKVPPMPPLRAKEVNVLTSAKDPIFPSRNTKVVILSYGLAPRMIRDGDIVKGMFKCAIVDESHMLKNKSSKRTSTLMPILCDTERCILLSGTPAFARPMELWPQLNILGTEHDSWWLEEKLFSKKYAKGGSRQKRAELHTLMTGTIMIRRLKNEILTQLPSKLREQVLVSVIDKDTREEFQQCIQILRRGKGAFAKLANANYSQTGTPIYQDDEDEVREPEQKKARSLASIEEQVRREVNERLEQGQASIREAIASHPLRDSFQAPALANQLQSQLRAEVMAFRVQRLESLQKQARGGSAWAYTSDQTATEPLPERRALLMHMYKKTGQVKIPLVVDLLKMWLSDPSKGKLCIFAHHRYVLDSIERDSGLSNASKGSKQFIRIDGSTGPKHRQDQINAFQNNPAVRIALLGITAAGVAVTLTASSTVWFAELFWTPALLIQAEDRCHRIGQQARVKCLFFCARGTLDEILWKHVEKKFTDLGEFVEGKEKMKMVVHTVYKGIKQLKASLQIQHDDDGGNNKTGSDVEDDDDDELAAMMEKELLDDFEEMQRSEQELVRQSDRGDDDDGDVIPFASGNTATPAAAAAPKVGSSEQDAICLSDDDEQETDGKQVAAKPLAEEGITPTRRFPNLRAYEITLNDHNGLTFDNFHERAIVTNVTPERIAVFGNGKPHVGDLLLAVNRTKVPHNVNIKSLYNFIDVARKRGPVSFTFVHDDELTHYYWNRHDIQARRIARALGQAYIGDWLAMTSLSPLPRFTIHVVRRFDFDIVILQQFAVVCRTQQQRPKRGDVLLALNQESIARDNFLMLRQSLALILVSGQPSELTFASADDSLVQVVDELLSLENTQRQYLELPSINQAVGGGGKDDVIELLDD